MAGNPSSAAASAAEKQILLIDAPREKNEDGSWCRPVDQEEAA
jgi:hypothetical protein